MSDSKKVFLFGYSGHACVIIESFIAAGYTIGGYFDFQEAHNNFYEIPYCGSEKYVDVSSIVKKNFVFPSVGDNKIRAKLIAFYEKFNLKQCILIDNTAKVSKSCIIGLSTYIGAHSIINAQSRIGKGVIINTGAIIEHECVVDDFSHIAPATVLCGSVCVGKESFIGANSVVRNNITICSHVILGAGSVVVKSIQDNGIWIGNPSKKIR